MQICSVCGASASNDVKFCQECGNPLPALENQPAAAPVKEHEPQKRSIHNENVQPKKPMKTSTKIISGIVAVFILGLVIAHFMIQGKLDPYEKLVDANKAFVAENHEVFAGYFAFDEGTTVDTKAFLKYMNEQQWTENISPQIEEGLNKLKLGTYADAIVDDEGNKLFTINEKKFLGIYQQYDIKVIPIEVSAYTSIPSATVNYTNDQQKELTTDTVSLGQFAPGIYEFKLDVSDDVSSTTVTQEKTVAHNGDKTAELFFDFSDTTVTLSSDYNDAIVFIDGESTKKKASELKLYTLPLDGSVEVYAVYTKDGAEKKSEKVTFTSTETHIPFADVQKNIEQEAAKQELLSNYSDDVKQFYYNFRDEYLYAVNNGDFSYVSSYFEEGSELKRDYEKFILDHRKFDYYYDYTFLSNDVTDVAAVNNNTLSVKTREIFEFNTDTEEDWYYERQKLYTIQVLDDEFIISNIEDIGEVIKTKL